VPAVGFVLGNDVQYGVPYYGDPIRGGIRVYLDDRYATVIKRQDLDAKKAQKGPDGELSWELATLLDQQGVDTSKVVEMYVIRDEQRAEKISGEQLATMMFQASAQAKGGILLGPEKLRANALAFHTRALKRRRRTKRSGTSADAVRTRPAFCCSSSPGCTARTTSTIAATIAIRQAASG
jgi:hypothetical protein